MGTSSLVRARLLTGALLLSITFVVASAALPAYAGSSSSAPRDATSERTSFNDANAARRARGIHTMTWSDMLANIARKHSQQMAAAGYIYHSENLPDEVQGWRLLGENVGEGPTISSIDDAFMQSPEHRKNILDRFTMLGVGAVRSADGTVWVTQIFMLPDSSSSRAPSRTTTVHHASARSSSTKAAPHRTTKATSSPTPHTAAKPASVAVAPAQAEPDPAAATGTMAALEALAAGEW